MNLRYPHIKYISYLKIKPNCEILKKTRNYYIINSKNLKKVSNKEISLNIFNNKIDVNKLTKLQKRELLKIADLIINYNEIFDFKHLKLILDNDIETHFIERLRLLKNIKCSTSLFCYILKFGITKGFEIYSNSNFKINNPGKNHGGRFSAYSKKFIKYQNLASDEIESKIQEINKKKQKTCKEHPENRNTNKEFYLVRGFSEQEAIEMIHQRQQTFSLKKCIEKYGNFEGTKIFNERQKKWQKSLNNKSREEIELINFKKGTGFFNKLYLNDPIVKKMPGILYFIHFYDKNINFYKIGITSKTIKQRFSRTKLNYDVLFQLNDTFYNVYKKEQKILKLFKSCRVYINYNGFKSYECFNRNILKEIINYAKIY